MGKNIIFLDWLNHFEKYFHTYKGSDEHSIMAVGTRMGSSVLKVFDGIVASLGQQTIAN